MRQIFLVLLGLGAVSANAALMSHFKGRYGAIEVLDAGKKLSFRVNPPELSSPRNFCQISHLGVVIAALEKGLITDANTPITRIRASKPESLTVKRALLRETNWVFDQLKTQITPAELKQLESRRLVPAAPTAASAFQILDWFKALEAGKLALKPATLSALKSLLLVKSAKAQKMYSLSSRCAETKGAVGASFGYVERSGTPIFFAVSVDGKSRQDLFGVSRAIRDAALAELKFWVIEPPKSVR